MAAKKNSSSKKSAQQNSIFKSQLESEERSFLTPYPYPDLVFGLVGPIGVSLDPVIAVLKSKLRTFDYGASIIRLSECIEEFFGSDHKKEPEHKRIKALMDEGTKLRVEGERGDAVALLAIAAIANSRATDKKRKTRIELLF